MNMTDQKGPVVAVVGPSGVGKDSLMAAMAAASPGVQLVQRIITRPKEAGGEDHIPATVDVFHDMQGAGDFALSWGAHGLFYGIPKAIEAQRIGASALLVNLSRGVLLQAQEVFDDFLVLSVTARPEVLAQRLSARGREDAAEVQRRLARASAPLPEGLNRVHKIDNSGDLAVSTQRALALLHPESA